MRYLLLFIWIFLSAADLQGELLLGVPFSSTRQLQEIENADLRVRYVAPQLVFVSGDESTLEKLQARGLAPFIIDESGPGEVYYLTDDLESDAEPSYVDPAGWALLRLPQEGVSLPYFLWALPENYSLEGWLRLPRSAKPTTPLASTSMDELLAQVDSVRLQQHIRSLALENPEGPSDYDNLRTRFVLRPETREATEYIRLHLAESLGEEAVEVQEFALSGGRLSSYLKEEDEEYARKGYNVIGTLPGTDPEAGYYIIGAHYDAIGARSRTWDWRTDPAPGADDNGSGVALVLESARVLAGQEFPWSIRFVAFAGEELGLLGSRDYVARVVEADDTILGVLNFDMLGYNNQNDRVELATNPASSWIVDLMRESNQRYIAGLQVDVLEDTSAILSDHHSFWARGYDAVLAIENYLPDDSTTYGVREGIYQVNSSYHTMADVPDSINWSLLHKCTQLAVATLAQYSLEEGRPNLGVFAGDLSQGEQDDLRLRVSNIGLGPLEDPFRVRVSRCGADSSDCEVIYDQEHAALLAPGTAEDIEIPWNRFGATAFLFEVDPEDRIAELSEEDNRAFQHLRLVPQNRIVVYPNPFRPSRDSFLSFSGVPSWARVRVSSLSGESVWFGAEERQGRLSREVRWRGVNQAGLAVGSGVYIYTITTLEGEVLEQDKVAVIW